LRNWVFESSRGTSKSVICICNKLIRKACHIFYSNYVVTILSGVGNRSSITSNCWSRNNIFGFSTWSIRMSIWKSKDNVSIIKHCSWRGESKVEIARSSNSGSCRQSYRWVRESRHCL